MKGKASSAVLYVVTAFVSAVGIIALVNHSELTWQYLLLWALSIIFCVIDAATNHNKPE